MYDWYGSNSRLTFCSLSCEMHPAKTLDRGISVILGQQHGTMSGPTPADPESVTSQLEVLDSIPNLIFIFSYSP